MAFDGPTPPQSLAQYFLELAGGNPLAALEAACATCEFLAAQVSRGFSRLPPPYAAREPKQYVDALTP